MIISDWEGPWVSSDHAYEAAKALIPSGDRIFSRLSEFDDYLYYVKKKENYEAGDTLMLEAPFLIAYNVSEKDLIKIAKKNETFLPGSREAIKYLLENDDIHIISTSYNQYLDHTCKIAGIPKEKYHCTNFQIDSLKDIVSKEDKEIVKAQAKKLSEIKPIKVRAYPHNELNPYETNVFNEMEEFFFEKLPQTSFSAVMDRVVPLGGRRKTRMAWEMARKYGKGFGDSFVIGDSITDSDMLAVCRNSGGAAVSFNGNAFAIENSNISIISFNSMIIPVVYEIWKFGGLDSLRNIEGRIEFRNLKDKMMSYGISEDLFYDFKKSCEKTLVDFGEGLPEIHLIDSVDDKLVERSVSARKRVRGYAGLLG